MKLEEYKALLDRLPIVNPTEDDMAMLCPHLTKQQAVESFMTIPDDHFLSSPIACPSLRVRYAFQRVEYTKAHTTGSTFYPAQLGWYWTGRLSQSYIGKAYGSDYGKFRHIGESIKFANDNWVDQLVYDTWDSFLEVDLDDPTEHENHGCCTGYPVRKAILYVTLNRDLDKIENDYSKPTSQLYDDAIAQMTLDPKIMDEIKGGRGGGGHRFNCAYCGGGLSTSHCYGCGNTFRDDQCRGGTLTPLSRKMVAFLQQNGHILVRNPEIEWNKELLNWKKNHKR